MKIGIVVCLFLTQQIAVANLPHSLRTTLSKKGFPTRLHKSVVSFVNDPISHPFYYSLVIAPLLKNFEQARRVVEQTHGASEAHKFEETMQLLDGTSNPVADIAKALLRLDVGKVEVDGEFITVEELLRRYKEIVAERASADQPTSW